MKPYAQEERPYACVETDEASACMVCLDCETQAREYHDLVKVSEKKQLFQFSVESTGALRPELIVLRGVEVLQRKLNDIRANLGSDDGASSSRRVGCAARPQARMLLV